MGSNYYEKRHLYSDAELVACYQKYESQCKAAVELGVSQTTVYRALKRAGIKPTGRRNNGHNQTQRKITDAQILEAVKVMTRQQIADKYGMHVEQLAKRMRKLGVHAVYDTSIKDKADTWHYSKAYEDLIKRTQPGFEFVSTRHRRMKLKCKICGDVIERDLSTIRQKRVRCDTCVAKERETKLKQEAIVKLMRDIEHIVEAKTPRVCQCCGETFYSQYSSAKWCPRCRRAKGSYHKRAKKYGAEYEHGISLRKVFIRDKGICQICGKPTDWHDYGWGNHFGPNYPTIDHIVALANGGSHTWDNVQLAHAICNSYKRDLI